jgi:hypothetical protein
MRPRLPAVPDHVFIVATGVEQGVSEDSEAARVE